ncbi:hypothetical protein ACWEKT_37510 [Nocardia takedensis]
MNWSGSPAIPSSAPGGSPTTTAPTWAALTREVRVDGGRGRWTARDRHGTRLTGRGPWKTRDDALVGLLGYYLDMQAVRP